MSECEGGRNRLSVVSSMIQVKPSAVALTLSPQALCILDVLLEINGTVLCHVGPSLIRLCDEGAIVLAKGALLGEILSGVVRGSGRSSGVAWSCAIDVSAIVA